MKLISLFLFLTLPFSLQSSPQPILIDTDLGVDDALAIAWAVKCPDLDIKAITTVFGNVPVEQASTNSCLTLDAIRAKGSIPIYQGCGSPIVSSRCEAKQWPGHGANGLGDASFPPSERQVFKSPHAAQAIVDLSKETDSLVIVALGPLTNLAVAVNLDPTLPSRIAEVIIMGGTKDGIGNAAFGTEFNFLCDPDAASVVLNRFAGKIKLITWELTVDNAFTWDWFDEVTAFAPLESVAAFFKAIMPAYKTLARENQLPLVICDLLLPIIAADPDIIIESQDLFAEVELSRSIARGAIFYDWYNQTGQPANVTLIHQLNTPAFHAKVEEMFEETLCQK